MQTLTSKSYATSNNRSLISLAILLVHLTLISACSHRNELSMLHQEETELQSETRWTTERPPSIKEVTDAVKNNTANEKMEAMGDWWFFGPGIGHTILNLGSVVVFPPYALYLLGNATLALTGNEPVRIIDIFPSGPKEVVNEAIDGVCSVPGRMTSLIASRPYVETLPLVISQGEKELQNKLSE